MVAFLCKLGMVMEDVVLKMGFRTAIAPEIVSQNEEVE